MSKNLPIIGIISDIYEARELEYIWRVFLIGNRARILGKQARRRMMK